MTKLDKLVNVLEYALALLFVYGGINTFFAEPLPSSGIVAALVGHVAIYFYAVLFLGVGLALLYSKVRKHKKMHGYSLLVMYLTCFYVLVLSVVLNGVTFGLTLTVISGVFAAYAWLRWKLRTEYIDPSQIYASAQSLRDDMPPVP